MEYTSDKETKNFPIPLTKHMEIEKMTMLGQIYKYTYLYTPYLFT